MLRCHNDSNTAQEDFFSAMVLPNHPGLIISRPFVALKQGMVLGVPRSFRDLHAAGPQPIESGGFAAKPLGEGESSSSVGIMGVILW